MSKLTRVKEARRIRRILDKVAYASLVLDIAIAAITLVSLNVFAGNLSGLLNVVDYALTAVVIISIALFVVLLFLMRYENLLAAYYGITRIRKKEVRP